MNKTRGLFFTAILCIAATAHAQNASTDPRDGKEYEAVIDQIICESQKGYKWEDNECKSPNIARSGDGNTSVQINKIWAEHNVEQNNERGMILHINFSAKNMYGKEGYVGVWFKENGRQLSFSRKKLFNNSEPYYKDFSYEDFKLFIPYSFDVQGYGKHDLKMDIYIADSKANSALARDSLNLTYTNSAPQYQQQYQQPQQQQQQQRDGLVDALDAFNAVLGTIATMNNQHQHNQYQQNQYQNSQYQNYQQDNGNCQARYDKWANQAEKASSNVSRMDKGKSSYTFAKKNLREVQKEMRHLRTGSECRGKIARKNYLEDYDP